MKINLSKEMREHSLIGGIVLHNITYSLKEPFNTQKFAEENRNEEGNIIVNLKLTMNDIELDLESYLKRWEKRVENDIKDHAKNMILDKFTDIEDLIYDLRGRIEPEIKKRLEDWGGRK